MNPTLKTTFAGIPMLNPFLLASAPPTGNCEMLARAFEAGWGGAVIKTVAYDRRVSQNVSPRIAAYKNGKNILGFTNFELGSGAALEQWLTGIRWLKEKFPDHVVLVSLLHTEELVEQQWRAVTRMFNDTGADGYELNLSCSHGMAESGGGAQVGGSKDAIKTVTRWVCEETTLPVMPKLPVMAPDLIGRAEAAKEAGAAAIASINTLNSIPGIDLYTFRPFPTVDGMSAYSGLSGRAIKPIALRTVAQLAGGIDLPISGIGGIYGWEDAAEFILAGASSLQICSAVMEYGYGCIGAIKQGLLNYMDSMNFLNIDSFRGKSLPYITAHNNLSRSVRMKAVCQKEKCINCGRCIAVCRDSGFSAIEHGNEKASVNHTKCDGCGLCTQVCPTNALSMVAP